MLFLISGATRAHWTSWNPRRERRQSRLTQSFVSDKAAINRSWKALEHWWPRRSHVTTLFTGDDTVPGVSLVVGSSWFQWCPWTYWSTWSSCKQPVHGCHHLIGGIVGANGPVPRLKLFCFQGVEGIRGRQGLEGPKGDDVRLIFHSFIGIYINNVPMEEWCSTFCC